MFMNTNLFKKEYKSNEIHEDILKYHQSMSEIYFKIYKQMKYNDKNLIDEITNWIFSFDILTRQLICSIDNNFTTKIIQFLFKQFKVNYKVSISLITSPNENKQNDEFNFFPKYIYEYDKKTFDNIEKIRKDNMEDEIEKIIKLNYSSEKSISLNDKDLYISLIFNDIRFFSLYGFNDGVTFSKELLSNKTKFIGLLNALSNNKVFISIPEVNKLQKENVFLINLPNWIKSSNISIGNMIVGLFEQVITTRFVISKLKNYTNLYTNTSQILFSNRLLDFFTIINSLSLFLSEEYSQSKEELIKLFISSLNIQSYHLLLINDESISDKIHIIQKQISQLNTYTSNLYPNTSIFFSECEKKTEDNFIYLYKNLNIFEFLDQLMLFDPKRLSK